MSAIDVKLNVFEGPLDLLLHLIEKNKVNIYDIPIVTITEQYLEYVEQMQEQDMDVMSEFLVMAGTLLQIKSKMLLPKEETEEEEQTISPRPIKCAPRPIRKKKEKPLSAPIANENTRHTPSDEKKRIALNTREEARRAFIYSEIFNRKY